MENLGDNEREHAGMLFMQYAWMCSSVPSTVVAKHLLHDFSSRLYSCSMSLQLVLYFTVRFRFGSEWSKKLMLQIILKSVQCCRLRLVHDHREVVFVSSSIVLSVKLTGLRLIGAEIDILLLQSEVAPD